ncbi:beta strand repeat-containing protein [Phascolarctobacterium sp.]
MKKTKLLLHKRILAAVLSGGMLLLPNWGYALPQGGTVVAGSVNQGSFNPSGNQMNITGSGNVAIDWNSFNIGKNETVSFSGMQAVLNYVTGNTKSEILGNITGNDVHVFLVNPNGILFGADAKVNVGQLTASTRTIEDRTVFDGSAFSTLSAEAAKKVRGDIINLGELTANKIVLEGDNISLLNAATLKAGSNSDITLRANNKVTVGYETSNYVTGAVAAKSAVDKGSVALAGANLECLNNKNKTGIAITDAMLVYNVDDLQAINNNLAGDYMLANDIDAKDATGFKSIGHMDYDDTAGGFSGTLDGLNCEIKNLTIEMTNKQNVGLFNIILEGASVKNLQMTNSSITGEAQVGGIAGKNYGTISNVTTNHKDITCTLTTVGGIVGVNYGKLDNVINKGTITSTGSNLGGIAGSNSGTINNARNEAAIEAKASNVGGIVGSNSAMGTISNSVNSGKITGSNVSNVGGIVGYNGSGSVRGGIIDSCTNTKEAVINITGGSNIGGIAGRNDFGSNGTSGRDWYSITNSNNYAAVSGKDHIGGIVGHNKDWIEKNQNFGAITGTGNYVGGIVGANSENPAIIENCTNSGVIIGINYVGGIAGYNGYDGDYGTAKITNSHNAESASVTGNSFVGGIVGYNVYTDTNGGAIVENSTNSGDVKATGYTTDKNGKNWSYIGGIAGYNYKGEITGVSNAGKVTGSNYAVGGVAGYNSMGDIANSYNKGIVDAGSSQYVGGITGYNSGKISDSYNENVVKGAHFVGGISGYSNGTITDVHNEKDGSIQGGTYIGGIVGYNSGAIGIDDENNTTVTNAGNITGTGNYVGGIVGYNQGTKSSVTKAYNSGTVTGSGTTSTYIGGISGKNEGTLTDVHNETDGIVNGVTQVGGIVGANTGDILKAANKGNVIGSSDYIGGIVGYNNKGTVSDSYNSSEVVSGNQQVGGISGNNSGTIQNVYNSGKINGTKYIGGIVGYHSSGSITNTYNMGKLSGTNSVGNIVGVGSGTVNNAYYASFDGDAIAGYLKYQGDGTLLSLEEFGQAFESGLRDEDKDSWKFYNGNTAPLLKGFLKKITIDGDTISGVDAVYNGSEQIAGLGGLADGILVGAKKEIGTYTLQDLLYSGQDGYDITISNDGIKFTIREVPPDEPQQPSQPEVPQESIYQNALVNIAVTERENRPEQQNIRQRIIDSPIKLGEEQAKVRIEGDGIKFGKEQIKVKVDDDGIKIEEEA